MAASSPTVGWFGLGSMGLSMALNLQNYLQSKGLPPLHYSNRNLSKGQPLQDAGAVPENDFESVVRKSEIIFTMISDDAVLNELLAKAVSADCSLKGKKFVDTSTVHPETCASAAERLREEGAIFVASPVFGDRNVAAAGKLIFSMAGPAAIIETLRPFVVDGMGRSVINMGEDVRKSSLLKISGNILVLSFMEVIAEAQVFAEVTDLGTQHLEEFIAQMFGPVLESYSKRITTGAYAPPRDKKPGFVASLACKDMKHALSIAESSLTRLPTLETAFKRLNFARNFAGESLDSSAVYGAARREAGLSFWNGNSRTDN